MNIDARHVICVGIDVGMMAKVRLYRCCWVFLALLLAPSAIGQQFRLRTITHNLQDSIVVSGFHLPTDFPSTTQCSTYIANLPAWLQSKGYLAASVDTFWLEEKAAIAVLFLGQQYSWHKLTIADPDLPLLTQIGYLPQQFVGKPLNAQLITQLQEKLLNYYENNGFPFAQVQFDSVLLHNQGIEAQLSIHKGVFYRLDSLRILGNATISHNFLYHYLNLPPGSPFSVKKFQKIGQQLQELPYVSVAKQCDLTMLSNTYLLNVYLQNKRSNQVNVLVGLLPANNQASGNVLLTGEANLNLKNAFATGETLLLNWQQLQAASPRLNMAYQKPFVFDTHFDVDASFELYKRDSAFVNIGAKLGIQYPINVHQTGKISLETFRTNVLNVDTVAVVASKQLPSMADVSTTAFSVLYNYNTTNYKPNPQSGNDVLVYLAIGSKTVRKNNAIVQIKNPDFNYAQLYDSVKLKTFQIKFRLNAAKYYRTGRQSVVKTALNVGWIGSDNYFDNELFQIGGYKLLRGFNEESIVTQNYWVGTCEYRYLIGINSYFSLFTDAALVKNNRTKLYNNYLGAGVGLALETKQGIFNISFALGKQNDVPFNAKQSKIHVGYISLF